MDALPLTPRPTRAEYEEIAERLVHTDGTAPSTQSAARDLLARLHGFDGWAAFAGHLDGLALAESETARYEAAADALVAGDLAALRALVEADRGLVRATSNRRHRSTLLHYVAANGVEDFRQRTPDNIVAITRFLLTSGAEVDAPNQDYAGGGTALGLVATSMHPYEAGVQLELMEVLADAGASLEGLPGAWRPMDAAVANGCPDAAAWLADRGARVHIIAAAALGHIERVAELAPHASAAELEEAFILGCGYGHTRVGELLLDRGVEIAAGSGRALRLATEYGHQGTVDMLLRRGAARA